MTTIIKPNRLINYPIEYNIEQMVFNFFKDKSSCYLYGNRIVEEILNLGSELFVFILYPNFLSNPLSLINNGRNIEKIYKEINCFCTILEEFCILVSKKKYSSRNRPFFQNIPTSFGHVEIIIYLNNLNKKIIFIPLSKLLYIDFITESYYQSFTVNTLIKNDKLDLMKTCNLEESKENSVIDRYKDILAKKLIPINRSEIYGNSMKDIFDSDYDFRRKYFTDISIMLYYLKLGFKLDNANHILNISFHTWFFSLALILQSRSVQPS